MQSQTLISIIVFWLALLCLTNAGSVDDYYMTVQAQKLELADKLNTLLRHSGWRSMDNVEICKIKNHRREVDDPMSAILKAVSLDRDPVNKFNAMVKYEDVFTVLRCKYAEVNMKCRILIQRVVRVCRIVKTADDSFQKYYDCFRLLLIKLHSISPRFKCMADSLNFMYSIGRQSKSKCRVTVAAEKLAEYTLTVGPKTSSKLFEHGINEDVVDLEMKNIYDYIMSVYLDNIYKFAYYHCNSPSPVEWSALSLNVEFENKKIHQQIPQEWTLVQYAIDEIDSYVSGIFDSCFYNLGFAYDLTGNVIIRNI